MAWDDEPPTKADLKLRPNAPLAWDAEPPSAEDLKGIERSAGRTALDQGADSVLLGHLPQVQAGVETGVEGLLEGKDKLLGAVGLDNLASTDYQLRQKGFTVPESTYVKNRDDAVRRLKEEEEQNPNAALAGKIGGGIVGALATPLPKALAAKGIMGGLIKGGAIGSGYGLLQNPGDKEGEVNPLQAEERVAGAQSGALTGALTGGAVQGVAKGLGALSRTPEGLKKISNEKMVKSMGPTLADGRNLVERDQVQMLGEFARDNNLVKVGDSVKEVADKAGKLREESGKTLEGLYKKAVRALNTAKVSDADRKGLEASGFNPVRDKEDLLAHVSDIMGDQTGKEGAIRRLGVYVDQLAKDHGDLSLDPKTMQGIKTQMDKTINWARSPLKNKPATEGAYQAARQFISDKIDDSIDLLGRLTKDDKALALLKKSNRDYGLSKTIEEMANDRSVRDQVNRTFGLTDTIAGGAGAAAGAAAGALTGSARGAGALGAIGAGIGAIGNKLGRTYGNPILAKGAELASKAAPIIATPAGLLNKSIDPNVLSRGLLEQQLLERKKQARP